MVDSALSDDESLRTTPGTQLLIADPQTLRYRPSAGVGVTEPAQLLLSAETSCPHSPGGPSLHVASRSIA